jgi:hypothetical protein
MSELVNVSNVVLTLQPIELGNVFTMSSASDLAETHVKGLDAIIYGVVFETLETSRLCVAFELVPILQSSKDSSVVLACC